MSISVINKHRHLDLRGNSFHDIFDGCDGGQINASTLKAGVIKAFHYHKNQTDTWFCIKGNAHVVLFEPHDLTFLEEHAKAGYHSIINENNEVFSYNYATKKPLGILYHYYIGELNPQRITIPPGILHGYASMYNEDATILYHVDQVYNAADEHRIAYDGFGKEVWETKYE